MAVKFKHTNIVAKDWRSLAKFYEEVFGCEVIPPKRNICGSWLEKGTGIKNAKFEGVHLKLPGYDDRSPTLEIYQYEKIEENMPAVANRKGFGHIAFEVDDVEAFYTKVLEQGGASIAQITSQEVEGVGYLTFVYVLDPEENIIELQNWQ